MKAESTMPKEQVVSIIQAIVDCEKLDGYFHPEVEGRIPLVVAENHIAKKDFELTKFGRKARILDKDTIKKENIRAFLLVNSIATIGDTVRVFLEYDIEGLSIEASLSEVAGTWQVTKIGITEK